jgi:carboxyl-terminal processing protease
MKRRIFLPVIFLTLISSAYGQAFHNLDFSQLCDTSKTGLCYWSLSWGGKGACTAANYNGNPCLLISGKTTGSVGFVEQTVIIKKAAGMQMMALSARLRTENVEGKGADLNIAMYGHDGSFLTNKDMGGYASLGRITGTHDYKVYTLKTLIPEGTEKIKIGAILYGKGKVMYDDFNVSIIPLTNRKPNALAIKYITAACDTIAKHSLVKDSININELKKEALRIAGPAKTYADCYPAVEYLISSLRRFGDVHSFFMQADEVPKWANDTTRVGQIEFPKHKLIGQYGYLSIPKFDGGNKKLIKAFADTIQEAIKKLDARGVKGWIIDLRDDMGGNMAPMIAGLGPLFSADTLGYLVDAYGKKDSWAYKDYMEYVTNPVVVSRQRPVAVLTAHNSGSSGEIVVISFIGNANTKSFGQPTWGLTTGNGGFDLMDGARMMLASTVMADRNGKLYHGSIVPDVMVNEANPKVDETLNKAIEWLDARNGN